MKQLKPSRPSKHVSRRWDDLDTELAEAVLNASHGAIKRELLLYQEARTRMRLPLAGRAALWMCFDRFNMDRGQARFIDITALTGLKFAGDLEGFLAAWGSCSRRCRSRWGRGTKIGWPTRTGEMMGGITRRRNPSADGLEANKRNTRLGASEGDFKIPRIDALAS